ncbi:MAG: XdhC family protein [Cyclobacteriaceae bacterium]|nr:XdhC family protein [Cyclobacteriaceae bacterium]
MKDYFEIIKNWSEKDSTIALARVIKTWGSSPRPVGSIMLINSEGKMAGSVSGGCVEGAVVKRAQQIIDEKKDEKLSYGISDDDAWSVGLSCGGSIQVFVQSIDFSQGVWKKLLINTENNKSSILISSLNDGNNTNTLIEENGEIIGDPISDEITLEAKNAYIERTNKTITYGDNTYFINVFPRKPTLLIIGAAHITVDLVTLGNLFGFETVVIDPRGYFAQNTTFQDAPSQLLEKYPSEVLHDFPLDAYTFCAILSHDPKIDDNALEILLPSKVGYIGALGSKKTHEKRTKRLQEKGISMDLINRIKAPIGMNIHAKSAKEIALAVMGQIIAAKNEFLN